MTYDHVSFHEADVIDLSTEGDTVRLVLDRATIIVRGVHSIVIDDAPAAAVARELDDGEVLTLEIGERHILLIVEWVAWAQRLFRTRAYEIHGETVLVSPPG